MSDTLKGKTVVFTGTLSMPRRQFNAIARGADVGATVRSKVSSNTDYVVAGKNAGGKLKEAADRGVTILSEGAFFEKVKEQRAANKAPKA